MCAFLASAGVLVTGMVLSVFEIGSYYVVLAGLVLTEIYLPLPTGIKSVHHHALRLCVLISAGTNEFCSMKYVLRQNAKKIFMHDI